MRRVWILCALALLGCGSGHDVSVTASEVVVNVEDFEVRYTRTEPFSGTFMVMGGGYFTEKNMVGRATVCGLPIEDARRIAEDYPDFDRCASPGAAEAKDCVVDMSLIAADSGIEVVLKKAIEQSFANIKSGGPRICVKIAGSGLKLASARTHEGGHDVADMVGRMDYKLATSAEIVDVAAALSGP